MHLHASPSFTFGREEDLSVAYLRSVLNFLGVIEQKTVLLHGDKPELGEKMEFEAARQKLLALARRF
jgi:hypothetical protein